MNKNINYIFNTNKQINKSTKIEYWNIQEMSITYKNIILMKYQSNAKKQKKEIEKYINENKLLDVCKSFEGQQIKLYVSFMDKNIKISNINIVGSLLEDVFFSKFNEKISDFEIGNKQSSPDYYAMNKTFEFEQKVFISKPGFDIGNFTSYINQLCESNGVFRKIFKTKYLIFEYYIFEDYITIKKFHYLNVFNLVSYDKKYPISMQVKKNIWYNIRTDSVNNWYSTEKTPKKFIENIIKCIKQCHHIDNKEDKINNIEIQMKEISKKYTF